MSKILFNICLQLYTSHTLLIFLSIGLINKVKLIIVLTNTKPLILNNLFNKILLISTIKDNKTLIIIIDLLVYLYIVFKL